MLSPTTANEVASLPRATTLIDHNLGPPMCDRAARFR
jgi:hypothetical protein